MNTINPFAILALNLETGAQEQEILKQLGLPYLSAIGKYKGDSERSYIIPLSGAHWDELNDILELARQYNQESVLLVDSNSRATLYFLKTDKESHIGTFVSAEKESDNCTLINGHYYEVV